MVRKIKIGNFELDNPKLMKGGLNEGKVYLVGAGPGDPGLLTLKAFKLLKECDVIIHDALLNPDILKYARPTAEIIFIGPSRHESRISQEEVERLMIQKAREGLSVVRLKGGDPFVFGRGGEEAEILTEAGISWEVVPGVSSGLACPAYAGIPLTHRDCASSVMFITGHNCVRRPQVEWETIRHTFNTLVIYMGVSNLEKIVNKLLESNYLPEVPIAIIESGTTSKQRIRTSTLNNIIDTVKADPVQTPALIIIGEVVKYSEKLSTFLSISEFCIGEEAMYDLKA